MANTTYTTDEFFKIFGDMQIKFADGVFTNEVIPTIEELYIHFSGRSAKESALKKNKSAQPSEGNAHD